MRIEKLMKTGIVLAFLSVLILPFVTADFQGGAVSYSENRYLALAPQFVKNGTISIDRKEVDAWINDNVGGRARMQEYVGRIDYILSMEHAGNVIEGKNQWLNLIPDYDIPEYTNTNIPSKDSLVELNEHLQMINDTLHENGISFVCTMLPRKFTVYPESVPETLIRHGEVSSYQTIADYLSKNDAIHFVSPYRELVAAKEERLTYSKAHDSSHWNNYGAWIGYQVLMREIQEVLPDIRVLTESDFQIEEREIETNLSNGYKTTESDLYYTLIDNHAIVDNEYLSSLGFHETDSWNCSRYYRNTDQSLPKAVIIGDSYIWMFMMDNLAQSFSELAFIHQCDISQLNSLINAMNADLVIGEFLGSTIWEICKFVPSRNPTQGVLDVIESEFSYMFLDCCDDIAADNDAVYIKTQNSQSFLEGWAIDPKAGTTASSVVIQVGDQLIEAAYGRERQSVVDYFQNPAYLQSGFTALLDTQEVLSAGAITVHVISADGAYQYPPRTYKVQNANAPSDISALPFVENVTDGFQFVDYCDDTSATEETIYVNDQNQYSFMEGWAIDLTNAKVAGSVVIQIGENYVEATYGKERATVSEA